MMRRICVLIIATAMIFAAGPNAMATDGLITDYDQVIHVHYEFNAFGVAINSVTTTTTTVRTEDEEGGWSETVTVQTVTSTWHGGGLKTDTVHVRSDTESSDGSTSWSEYTDTYSYDDTGVLTGVSGSGSTGSYDAETGHTTSGTISRTFEVRDGQALLLQSSTSGDMYDANDEHIGSFINTTTIASGDYAYLGGSWVAMKQTSASRTTYDNGSWESITRVTTYERNEHGVITGMSQTATGKKVIVTGEEGEEVSEQHFILTNYSVTVAFDLQMGWYIASEDFDWQLDPAWHGWGDPAASGTVYQGADGNWYMDVTVWTGEDGNVVEETITIELDLDALSPEQRADMEAILQEFAESGELLTLHGFSADGLSQGAKLMVVGLGQGSFTAHPFDFEGEIPLSLQSVNEDFAEFVSMMQDSPYWNQVFGDVSTNDDAWAALKGLYDALMDGSLTTGGSVTINGFTFSLKYESRNGGEVRIDCTVGGKTYHMRHLEHDTCVQLGLL